MRFAPLFLLLAACTDRFIQIRSEPPGATAFLDGKEIGRTPCQVPFAWYGDRELVLEKPGYRSRTEILRIRAPWWQWPVLDFFTDVVLIIPFIDRREFGFVLEKHASSPATIERLKRNADELRKSARENP